MVNVSNNPSRNSDLIASLKSFLGVINFILFVLIIYIVWQSPQWLLPRHALLSPHETVTLGNDIRRTLILIVGCVAALSIFYFVFKRVSLIEKRLAYVLEGQITERFTRAIEQLGTHRLETQIAGIFTLEQIAKESRKEHSTVMEVLTAYVRENSRYVPKSQTNGKHVASDREKKPDRPGAQIQSVMTVLGRRHWIASEIEEGKILNLRRTNLSKLDLRRVNLAGVNLRGVNLYGANLAEANLAGAFLAEANLKNAILVRANLTGAIITDANLDMANLKEANLDGANFCRSNLKAAFLVDAFMDVADFTDANLENSELAGVSMKRVNLTNVRFAKARYDLETSFPEWLHHQMREEMEMELIH